MEGCEGLRNGLSMINDCYGVCTIYKRQEEEGDTSRAEILLLSDWPLAAHTSQAEWLLKSNRFGSNAIH